MKAKSTACVVVLAFAGVFADAATSPASAQTSLFRPRVYISAWGGGYTSFGGFAESLGETNAFYNFDRDFAYGGGLHIVTTPLIAIGVDGSYGSARYHRHDDGNAEPTTSGDARVASALLSARLGAGGGGRVGIYLTGGIGAFAYDLQDEDDPEFDGWDADFALSAGAGLNFSVVPRLGLFVDYGQVWAFHPRDGDQNNTANHGLVRLGTRLGL